MSLAIRVCLSLLVVMLMFEGMISAFHLLNLPSHLAVLAGMCLLPIIAVGGFVVVRWIWRYRSQNSARGLRKGPYVDL